MASALNLGELEAFSKAYGDGSVNDNFFNTHALLKTMQRTRKTYPGGPSIRVPLALRGDPKDNTGGAIPYTGGWDFTTPEFFDAAEFIPKMEFQVIVIWDYEVSLNGTGETQYADLVMERQKWYTKIMADRKSRYLYGRGGDIKPNGLDNIFDNGGMFGNIDRSKTKVYNTYLFDASDTTGNRNVLAANVDATYGGKMTRRLLAQSLTSVTDNAIRPDIGITSPEVKDQIEAILSREERYPNQQMVDAGFDNITYRGVPIIWDKEMPLKNNRHQFYWLNLDFIRDYMDQRFNMKRQPWARMPNNAGQFEVIINIGNLGSNNLRYQSMIDYLDPYGISAAA